MRGVVEHASGLGEVARLVTGLSARTVVFDVEPLVSHWSGTREELDGGVARVLDEMGKVPTVEVVCFSTNSARTPSVVPSAAALRVVYIASAGKPGQTAAYQQFPRPGVVIGDQVPTDGILAWRLGYVFIQIGQPEAVPTGSRLMAAAGLLMRPLFFRSAPPR